MSAQGGVAVATVNATRFRDAHGIEWAELDRIVTQVEKRSVRSLDDEDLLALPVLYRAALSSLSIARETSLDRALVTYLEHLCTRAYFLIYGVSANPWRQIGGFFTHGWPQAVQALWRETLVALVLLLLGTGVGYLLVSSDPGWFYGIIPPDLANGRDPSASADTLRAALYSGSESDPLVTFATFLFTHNAQMALFAFALGFAFAVPTALLLVYNGAVVGAFLALYLPKGLGMQIGGWLLIHGTTELFAIVLASAAGFRIGMAVAFPGRLSRIESATAAGRASGLAMAGVVLMLLVAGLLEGIGRQTIQVDWQRYLVAFGVLAAWLVYFYTPRGRDGLVQA